MLAQPLEIGAILPEGRIELARRSEWYWDSEVLTDLCWQLGRKRGIAKPRDTRCIRQRVLQRGFVVVQKAAGKITDGFFLYLRNGIAAPDSLDDNTVATVVLRYRLPS